METILQIIKNYFIPGSAIFLVISLAVGVILLYIGERTRRWGKIWLTVLAIVYWIISTPLGAKILEAGLTGSYKPVAISEPLSTFTTFVSEKYKTEPTKPPDLFV